MLISLVGVDLVVVGRTDRTTLCDELVGGSAPEVRTSHAEAADVDGTGQGGVSRANPHRLSVSG
jgi:hypothetical protein